VAAFRSVPVAAVSHQVPLTLLNHADTSTAAITASNYLYGFTNSSSAVQSGAEPSTTVTTPETLLSVVATGSAAAGNALIFGNGGVGGNSLYWICNRAVSAKFSGRRWW